LVGKDLQVEPQKAEEPIVDNYASGLTYKQQLKQDAMLWAKFLYAEYKREKAQVMPTHYDKPNA